MYDKHLEGLARSLRLDEMTQAEKGAALQALGNSLNDWQLRSGFASLDAYKIYFYSGRVVLPYAGGWLDQPLWVHEDFATLNRALDFIILNADQPENPNPTFENKGD